MVEILHQYGAERIIVDSACDWGISEPLGVYKTAKLALENGIPKEQVELACYGNALAECRGENGGSLGVHGLLERARQLDAERPSELACQLMQRIRGEHRDNLDQEDATLLLCRATATPVAWQDNVLAPFRLLRAVSDRTRMA